MTRELPCGIQHNLYVDKPTLPYWKELVAVAASRGESPSKLICTMIKDKFKKRVDKL